MEKSKSKQNEFDALKLENQLCFPLYAASREVVKRYRPFLDPLGLTYTQYIVFLVLWEKDGISVTEIGEKLMLDNGTLSPLLKKMEQAGYVERRRCRKDDRIVEITLTEAGRALQERAKDVPGRVAGCIDLPPEKAKMLYALLYELLENQKNKNDKKTEEHQNENSL
jgi:DNA-binding MarR family transcriptional regulator